MSHMAYNELQRVRKMVAFNISGAIRKRKLNQFATEYTFSDSSILKIYSGGRGQTWSGENANCDCVSMIRANKIA